MLSLVFIEIGVAINEEQNKHDKAEARVVKLFVDFTRCEAKGPCVEVCPYDVFEIRKIDTLEYGKLSFFKKIKNKIHGSKVAYTPRLDLCRTCGLCVKACPEEAIHLVKNK
jgi:4Fe-4S ferredoxin